MRQIDADAFKAEGRKLYTEAGWDLREVHYSQLDMECNIDIMPTIEAEPVRHGRWMETEYSAYDNSYKCSACGEVWEFIEGTPKDNGANYCPNCGAKMDKEE